MNPEPTKTWKNGPYEFDLYQPGFPQFDFPMEASLLVRLKGRPHTALHGSLDFCRNQLKSLLTQPST